MVDFFSAQLDYVFFVYGLAFLLLGVVCFSMRQPGQRFLPWHYLGLFGFIHGLNEWLDLLAFSVGDSPALGALRLTILIGSFALLVEFGRNSFARLGYRGIGRWVYAPIAVFLLLSMLIGGPAGLNGGARYALGLVGSLWAAAALFARARVLGRAAALRLRMAGGFLLLYGCATGLVVPASPLLLAPWLNQDSFFAATGLPIQFLRAFLACGAAATVWAYEQQRLELTPLRSKRTRYFELSTLALLITLLCGWVVTERLGNLYRSELQRQVEAQLSLLAERLEGTMAVTRGLSRTMSTSPSVEGAPTPSARLDGLMDRYSRAGSGLLVYVLDTRGNVVAASNRNTPASLVGHNFAHRAYFESALAGGEGGMFAVGINTGLPGYYASAPVRARDGRVIGIAVIKKSLDATELGLHHFENGFLVNEDGVVLLGLKPGGPLRLWPSAEDPAGGEVLARQRLHQGDRLRIDGRTFLVGVRPVPSGGWSIVVLQHETVSLVSRLFGIALTLLISVLILLASFGLQREIGTEIQLHQNQQRLQELSDRLERQAVTDTLTGAFNRLKFDEVLALEMERASRYGAPLCLIMYDIDHFKRINDRYGHQAGDRVLVELTRLVSANTRASDTLARWGGEEFMIVVPHATLHEATALAEKLRRLIADTAIQPEPVTCSFGVVARREDDSKETLTARADQALYQAKTAGRNLVQVA